MGNGPLIHLSNTLSISIEIVSKKKIFIQITDKLAVIAVVVRQL